MAPNGIPGSGGDAAPDGEGSIPALAGADPRGCGERQAAGDSVAVVRRPVFGTCRCGMVPGSFHFAIEENLG